MTGLLILAAVAVGLLAGNTLFYGCFLSSFGEQKWGDPFIILALALIAVALWLAYAAGGAA